MTREELEAENARLKAALAKAGIDAQRVSDLHEEQRSRHQVDLRASRAETRAADQRTDDARADAVEAAGEHQRQMADAAADLSASEDLVAALSISHAALATSEARQRAIFEGAADIAMIVTDPAGIITDWNPGAENVLGWTVDEMRGQDAERFFTPEDRAHHQVEREMTGATGR